MRVYVFRVQLFAWDSTQKGEELHAQADPTLAMMHKKHKNSKEDFKTNQRSSVLDRYGGVEHLDAPPKELLMAQSEMYVTTSSGLYGTWVCSYSL